MALSKDQKKDIEEILKASLRNKFQNYNPEPASMPFHTRLLGKDRLALYSFIHSLNTNFGTSIFEPVGLLFTKKNFKMAVSGLSRRPDSSRRTGRNSKDYRWSGLLQQILQIKKKKPRE